MNDWMDISVERRPVFGRDADKVKRVPLLQQRVQVRTGENSFTFQVPKKPLGRGDRHDHLFFDRVPEDNRKRVEVKSGPG